MIGSVLQEWEAIVRRSWDETSVYRLRLTGDWGVFMDREEFIRDEIFLYCQIIK
jgi:hypothetical protein